MIEDEVKKFIQQGYDTAFKILTKKKKEWERLAAGLLEYETLTGEEIKKVMNGDPPFSDDEDKDDGSATAPSVTAIPKTKSKPKPSGTMEPEPS